VRNDLEKRAEMRRKKALEEKQAELNREAGLPSLEADLNRQTGMPPLEQDSSTNKRRRTTRIPSIRVKQEPKTYVPPIPAPPPPKRVASPPSMPNLEPPSEPVLTPNPTPPPTNPITSNSNTINSSFGSMTGSMTASVGTRNEDEELTVPAIKKMIEEFSDRIESECIEKLDDDDMGEVIIKEMKEMFKTFCDGPLGFKKADLKYSMAWKACLHGKILLIKKKTTQAGLRISARMVKGEVDPDVAETALENIQLVALPLIAAHAIGTVYKRTRNKQDLREFVNKLMTLETGESPVDCKWPEFFRKILYLEEKKPPVANALRQFFLMENQIDDQYQDESDAHLHGLGNKIDDILSHLEFLMPGSETSSSLKSMKGEEVLPPPPPPRPMVPKPTPPKRKTSKTPAPSPLTKLEQTSYSAPSIPELPPEPPQTAPPPPPKRKRKREPVAVEVKPEIKKKKTSKTTKQSEYLGISFDEDSGLWVGTYDGAGPAPFKAKGKETALEAALELRREVNKRAINDKTIELNKYGSIPGFNPTPMYWGLSWYAKGKYFKGVYKKNKTAADQKLKKTSDNELVLAKELKKKKGVDSRGNKAGTEKTLAEIIRRETAKINKAKNSRQKVTASAVQDDDSTSGSSERIIFPPVGEKRGAIVKPEKFRKRRKVTGKFSDIVRGEDGLWYVDIPNELMDQAILPEERVEKSYKYEIHAAFARDNIVFLSNMDRELYFPEYFENDYEVNKPLQVFVGNKWENAVLMSKTKTKFEILCPNNGDQLTITEKSKLRPPVWQSVDFGKYGWLAKVTRMKPSNNVLNKAYVNTICHVQHDHQNPGEGVILYPFGLQHKNKCHFRINRKKAALHPLIFTGRVGYKMDEALLIDSLEQKSDHLSVQDAEKSEYDYDKFCPWRDIGCVRPVEVAWNERKNGNILAQVTKMCAEESKKKTHCEKYTKKTLNIWFKERKKMNYQLFAIMICNKVISFAVICTNEVSKDPAKKEVVMIKTVKEYQRKGAAHCLVKWVLDVLYDTGTAQIQASIYEENLSGVDFWKSQNWSMHKIKTGKKQKPQVLFWTDLPR